ncbi:VID27 [Candida theae]|uniref:VID27 n=1 Tax=Candida theae TaxID=1198502 RepID=A0AAD5BHN9_9ASCO|nr:VID27 [Candida theae]KAI5962748.1 VID27 [Candida theae]
MNFIKKFIGTASTDEVASIPSGKLFLTRSKQSPKGEIECLYNDAYAAIKQTTTPFFYQLCITKVYQEGERQFGHDSNYSDDDYDEDEDDEIGANSSIVSPNAKYDSASKDEWVFPITEDLRYFRKDLASDGSSRAIAWKDLNGDLGDKFEFIVGDDVRNSDFESFMTTIYKCLYEEKYHESSIKINDLSLLKEFIYKPELLNFEDFEYESDHSHGDFKDATSPRNEEEQSLFVDNEDINSSASENEKQTAPKGDVVYSTKKFALHLYDSATGTFVIKSSSVELELIDLSEWEHTLYIRSSEGLVVNATVSKNMNPTFNYEHQSFIFNHYTFKENEIVANSWLLKFLEFNGLVQFQNKFVVAMYETLNKKKFGADKGEDEYFVDAFSNLGLDDTASEVDDDDDDEKEEDEEEKEDEGQDGSNKLSAREFNKELQNFSKKDKNTYLSVGYKDRAYVARGDKIGVFSQDDKALNFQTTINNVTDLKGHNFNPEKMLLHQEDQFLILSNPDINDKVLYKMDLNRGKVVEEWKISDNVPIKSYAPSSKFAQLTNQQTLTGISSNGLFEIDPRLSGTKLVNDQTYKQYKTSNNKFQALATTESGHIALGSGKGDIRLFDRLGVNAKTALPTLGDPIVGIDVSKDGRWILATCKTYILLIDTMISSGQKNAGKSGFTAYFDKDKKPTPRRLRLLPEHEAFINNANHKKELQFTRAYFNTGLDKKETAIVSSTDNYIITWSLSKVLKNDPTPYVVKRYKQNVVADNFKYGSNNQLITALQDDVSMVSRRSLVNPKDVFQQ